MKTLLNAVGGLVSAAMTPEEPSRASANDYPNKPIRFIVPYAANGPGTLVASLIGQKLSERWGQPITVENHPGAGGMIGTGRAIKAPADGHTLILAAAPHFINPSIYNKLPYDPVKDFQAVTWMISNPNVLIVPTDLPVNSVSDLIDLARSKPGQLRYASGGVGTPSHLAAELLKTMTGVDIVHVPFKGHADAGKAVHNGEVSLLFDAILLALPEIKSGSVKALAVTSAKRSNVIPDVPAVAESGLPGFDFSPGVGILVRAGTPNPVVNKIYDEIRNILQLPDVKQRMADDGGEIIGSSPSEFSAYLKQEIKKWAKVVKAAGIPTQ